MNAGLDMAMWVDAPDQWQSAIQADVQSGQISEARIDESVRRILTLKFELGLFDQPCVTDFTKPCVDPDAGQAAVQAGRDATLQAARESMTLLKNASNVLPIARTAQVLVTGPNADSMVGQLGGWSVSWQGVSSSGHTCCEGPRGQIPPGTTVRKAIEAADPNCDLCRGVASGHGERTGGGGQRGRQQRRRGRGGRRACLRRRHRRRSGAGAGAGPESVARRPGGNRQTSHRRRDGRPADRIGRDQCAERQRRADGVPGQYRSWTGRRRRALWRCQPERQAADQLANGCRRARAVRTSGDFNGGAASPLGDQPKFFDQLPSTSGGTGNAYNPLFTFGFGLSYTTFTTDGLSIAGPSVGDRTMSATFTVTNTGSRAGTEIVPVFVHQATSDVVVPPHRLVGFARVPLDAGQSRTVNVEFPLSVLAVTPGDIDSTAVPQVERGVYTVEVPNQVQPDNLFPNQTPPLHVDFSIS